MLKFANSSSSSSKYFFVCFKINNFKFEAYIREKKERKKRNKKKKRPYLLEILTLGNKLD